MSIIHPYFMLLEPHRALKEPENLYERSAVLRSQLATSPGISRSAQHNGRQRMQWLNNADEEDRRIMNCMRDLAYIGSKIPTAGLAVPQVLNGNTDAPRTVLAYFKKFCCPHEWDNAKIKLLSSAIACYPVVRCGKVRAPIKTVNWIFLISALADKVVADLGLPQPNGEFCIFWQASYIRRENRVHVNLDRVEIAERAIKPSQPQVCGCSSIRWVNSGVHERWSRYLSRAVAMGGKKMTDADYAKLVAHVVQKVEEVRRDSVDEGIRSIIAEDENCLCTGCYRYRAEAQRAVEQNS